ncbi:hypothetical protein KIPB_010155 [Kipferlia bialata]|uniref:Uncharacterized protein n=1 Tax=Kipferlia bialata TaxID=797122 RepID=A0A9K3D2S6_9EUKA|nr:hypothetical protein KIPB_010155 [Kipferlia bialata]|eukprot:g10155.t1
MRRWMSNVMRLDLDLPDWTLQWFGKRMVDEESSSYEYSEDTMPDDWSLDDDPAFWRTIMECKEAEEYLYMQKRSDTPLRPFSDAQMRNLDPEDFIILMGLLKRELDKEFNELDPFLRGQYFRMNRNITQIVTERLQEGVKYVPSWTPPWLPEDSMSETEP